MEDLQLRNRDDSETFPERAIERRKKKKKSCEKWKEREMRYISLFMAHKKKCELLEVLDQNDQASFSLV